MSFKNKLTIITLAILISTVTLSNVHAWVEPTTIPPGNNIFAPINSSAFGQSKIGGLILNIGNATHGLIVRYGLVGIGTDDPQAKLDVVGKVRSTGLEVNSTTEGVLFPRMTTAERDAIANKVEGLLIYNTDSNSKQLEIYTDSAWKPIGSGGGDSLPKGTIAFFNLPSCPSGWAEKTELKGRYPVGLPNSGTLGQSVGTALTNGEDRAVGQHNHGVTDPGHAHNLLGGGGNFGPGTYGSFIWGTHAWSEGRISSSFANISIQNSGSVAGTNAPYLQLLACEKQTEGGSSSGGTTLAPAGITSCPSGFTMIGISGKRGTFCIDTNQRPMQTFQKAFETCDSLSLEEGNAFLCNYREWYKACRNGAPVGIVGDWEWIAEFSHVGYGDDYFLVAGASSCSDLNGSVSVSTDNVYGFRCCLQ